MNDQLLLITAIGKTRPGIVADLSKICLNCGLNVADSRLSVSRDTVAIILELSGDWAAMAKMENQLPKFKKLLGLDVLSTRIGDQKRIARTIPYSVQVISVDRPGIMFEVTDFFTRHRINIIDCRSEIFNPGKTETPLYSLNLVVQIPEKVSISDLREEFFSYSDARNLDAVLEPHKS